MKKLAQVAVGLMGLLMVAGLWVSVIMPACSKEELPAESVGLPETGSVSVADDSDDDKSAEVDVAELTESSMDTVGFDDIGEDTGSSGAPQLNVSRFPDLDCGETCGFWEGEHYITIETSECETGDPRIGATIPFEPEKGRVIDSGDLQLSLTIRDSLAE